MNKTYRDEIPDKIANRFQSLEIRIMEDIIRRIQKAGKITSTADWQINRLTILGNSTEEIETMIKETLDASYPEIFELYDKVIDWEYVRNKDIYEQINVNFVPYEENEQLQQLTAAIIEQTDEDLENITQSLGFYLDYGNGKRVMTPLAQIYQNYLNDACMDIVFGTFDYNSVLKRAVSQLTNSGLRRIDYASGHSNRATVAARRAVMTGITQLTGHISDMNAEKLGTEYFEVAWHSGARPTHAVWQGRVWSKKELETICGLGTGDGLCGWNCYHEYYPFIPGISERNWTDEWLQQENEKENTPKEWNGKGYTLYEAKQKQRQMETAMRAQREKVLLLKQGGADPDDIMLARAKYQGQLNEYSRFSKKMNLVEERERIYIDNLGRVATNTQSQNAKYTTQMIRNATKDSKQYQQYKSILGTDAGTLAEFRQMKYNKPKEFEIYTWYAKAVDQGNISPLLGYNSFKNTHKMLEKEFVGTKTSDGLEIKGVHPHFTDRYIGQQSADSPSKKGVRNGSTVDFVRGALENPVNIMPIVQKENGHRSKLYVGDNAAVSYNPDTNMLIQVQPIKTRR